MLACNRRSLLHRRSIALVAFFTMAASAPGSDKVEWRVDYDSARREASEKGRPLFLDFGTEDCVHCRRMDQTTFRDPTVVKMLNEQFVPLKIDANREPRLTQSLRIQAYPTFIMAGHDGKITGWIEGYLESGRIMDHLARSAAMQTPDWMARDFQEASKAIGNGDFARAVSLLKNVIEDGKGRPVQDKARESLQQIEAQAAARLARVRQMDEKGQALEALDQLTDLMRQFAGTQAAAEGGKLLTLLADKPDIRARQRVRRAEEMLHLAREDFKAQRYLSALDWCEILTAAYRDLPEAKEAAELSADIKGDPHRTARVCEEMNDRLTKMYMELADSWLKRNDREQAAACLEKVLRINPTGTAAASAQARLAQLNKAAPAVPTGLEKP
jgi:uncharacterized protein YyaL (SSP411 family)